MKCYICTGYKSFGEISSLSFLFLLPPLPPHPQTVRSPEPGQELGLRSAGAHRATADRSDVFVPQHRPLLSLLRFSWLGGWVG